MSQVTSNTSMALDCSLTSRRILQVAIYINAVTCLDFITATHTDTTIDKTPKKVKIHPILSHERDKIFTKQN